MKKNSQIINIDIVHKEGIKRKNINYELVFYIAHGIDHLNGKLFVDHISKLRKQTS